MQRRFVLVILGSIATVCVFATVQQRLVLHITMGPRELAVPIIVGALFGTLLATVLALRERVHELNGRLAMALSTTSAALDATRAQLVQAGRQQAVALVAGGLAHDLNNLFTVALTNVTLLQADVGPEAHEHLEAIQEALQRASALTRRVTQLGRPPSTGAAPRTDLAAQVNSALAMVHRALPEQTRVECVVGPEPVPVHLDGSDIDQMVLNLVFNARDAMPDGGTITVRVDRAGERGRLVVQDGGYGMDEATRLRIFEPFFTRRPDGRGTGLGLAVVQDVVTRGRGTVDVESEPGRGTTFTVSFPQAV